MPVITVYGLPADEGENGLRCLYEELKRAVLEIEELGLTEDQLTFFFPPDRMKYGLGKEIIAFVDGLFVKPARTEEVRGRLARNIGSVIKRGYGTALVEVFVKLFDPVQGFWSSR